MEKLLQYLSLASSILVVVASAAFFFGGEWQDWKKVKSEVLSNAKPSSEADLSKLEKRLSEKFSSWSPIEKQSNLAGGAVGWTSLKCPVGSYVTGIEVEGYDAKYCNTCIYKMKATCRPLPQ